MVRDGEAKETSFSPTSLLRAEPSRIISNNLLSCGAGSSPAPVTWADSSMGERKTRLPDSYPHCGSNVASVILLSKGRCRFESCSVHRHFFNNKVCVWVRSVGTQDAPLSHNSVRGTSSIGRAVVSKTTTVRGSSPRSRACALGRMWFVIHYSGKTRTTPTHLKQHGDDSLDGKTPGCGPGVTGSNPVRHPFVGSKANALSWFDPISLPRVSVSGMADWRHKHRIP